MTQRIYDIEISKDAQTSNEVFESFVNLCLKYNIVVRKTPDSHLYFFENQLYLKNEANNFSLNWFSDLKRHLTNSYKLSQEPLAKALGVKKSKNLTIADATLGTGKDAILMLSFGASVIGHERNVEIFCMCLDALERARTIADRESYGREYFEKFSLVFGEVIDHPESVEKCDIIYYDPMYPEKKKSALARKEMQVFQDLVGVDLDISEQMVKLIESRKKVILKRPLKSEVLLKPCAHFKGKTTRYDLYFKA